MTDICNVLEASHGSGDVIIETIYEYGENSLGNGIRKLATEMFNFGYEKGIDDTYVMAFNDGHLNGWNSGYVAGNLDSIIKGSVITAGIITISGFAIYGVNRLVQNYNINKLSKEVSYEGARY